MNKDSQEVPLKRSKVGGTNFLITIYSQDNMNLHGAIQWLDLDLSIHFRNTLELLELIEEAVNLQNDVQNTKRSWKNNRCDKAI